MIVAYLEHADGRLNERSLEMLSFGRYLAGVLELPLHGILIGDHARALASGLSSDGVSVAYVTEDDRLTDYAPDAFARCITSIIESCLPQAVLAAGTERGHEIMARVASRLDLPLATNCLQITPQEDDWALTRQRWGGSLLEDALLDSKCKLLTTAAYAVCASSEANQPSSVDVRQVRTELDETDLRLRVTSRVEAQRRGISLADARVIISGGRGVGGADGFKMLEDLAETLGAAVGCSRVATSLGWRSHSDQVGQTGTRVAPELYVACGISGAIQHLVGCKGAKHILAINNDADAPMVTKADYAIIGDLHQIVPVLTQEIRKLKQTVG